MEDFKYRLLKEHNELKTKIKSLTIFMKSENFKKIEIRQQQLLIRQISFMRSYCKTLKLRLDDLLGVENNEL